MTAARYATPPGPTGPPLARFANLTTPADKSPLRLLAGLTSVSFTWSGDRWQHAVAAADGRRWWSIEGAVPAGADPRWPASPVLVEVSLVVAGSRPAVLGVGLAGRSHFSLSVVACPDRPDTLLFEAACRIAEPAGWLGSTYDGDGGRERVAADRTIPPPATVRWSYRIGPAGLEPLPGSGS
jgi:hypothetical protein